MSTLRFLVFFSLTVWLGGIILFSVLAPTAFAVLPTHITAALIVGPMLSKLHWMGISSGILFLLCSVTLSKISSGKMRPFSLQNILIYLMLALTCISQFAVMPRMAALRKAAGDIELLALTDPARMQFDVLHVWSTRLEGAVLLLGLVVLFRAAQLPKLNE